MTKIDFYFDPTCPFSWITSRWLLQVSAHRNINITWRQFSLALKNDELTATDDETSYARKHRASHRVHRVIAAAARDGAAIVDLYTAFGTKYHVAGFDYNDEWIGRVLDELGLAQELSATADDESLDTHLASELAAATAAAGRDIGVPTIVFHTDAGALGYFGPVLNTLPELDESLDIWDGLARLATTSSFYEIKRTRPRGSPDIASTARC